MISESDISILIPTYRYRDKVVRAVRSALASGAGEVIVSDDRSGDGTMEVLAGFSDRRLKLYENVRNLGLWENHLQALRYATRPWVKFLQADDYLLPGGLARYAAAADEGVSVVWSLPTVRHETTGAVSFFHRLSRAHRVDATQLFDACVAAGWILGTPSHMLLKAKAIERDPAVWRTTISADLVFGAIAATRGDIVLLPESAIGHAHHNLQDSHTQTAHRGLTRMVSTFAYLRARPELQLVRFADLLNAMTISHGLRTAARGLLRGEGDRFEIAGLGLQLITGPGATGWRRIIAAQDLMGRARYFRKVHRGIPDNLDFLFERSADDAPKNMRQVAQR